MNQATLDMPAPIATRTNLPAALTNFIGRERERAQLRRLLTGQSSASRTGDVAGAPGAPRPSVRPTLGATLARGARLLTVTGPGGAGKTRLALEVAADLTAHYQDGVWLVELATLAEPTLVPQAVAAVVVVREARDQPLDETLIQALQPRHLLLVLDNCEHLAAACARLVEALLRACPRLQVLATSREPLGLAGELVWPVPPLVTPDPTQPARGATPFASLLAYESVRLFVERARAAAPGFEPSPDDAAAIARICYHLDGVPLAIELAAARTR
jgi:predicted ATPase